MKGAKVVVLTLLIMVSAIVMLSTDVEYCKAPLTRFRSYEELKEFLQCKRHSFEPGGRWLSVESYGLAEPKAIGGYDYSKTLFSNVSSFHL